LALPLGELRCPAVVNASRTFSLALVAPGQYSCALRDGLQAGGQGLVSQRILRYERDDLVEMRLEAALRTGTEVPAGRVLATVRSLHHDTALGALQAQRAAVNARRALLVAGGRPEAVESARLEVAVAVAEREAGQAELERLRLLATTGLVSPQELEVAQLEDEVRRRKVEAARAGVEVARDPARQPALDQLDAHLAALDATITELERLLDEERVVCPIDGVVDLGASDGELRVHCLDPVVLDVPVPADSRLRVEPATTVLFATPAVPGVVFRGSLADVAPSPTMVLGRSVFWSTVEVPNPVGSLRRGMTGTALIPLDGRRPGAVSTFRLRLLGPWS
jgi:hypothetical protein